MAKTVPAKVVPPAKPVTPAAAAVTPAAPAVTPRAPAAAVPAATTPATPPAKPAAPAPLAPSPPAGPRPSDVGTMIETVRDIVADLVERALLEMRERHRELELKIMRLEHTVAGLKAEDRPTDVGDTWNEPRPPPAALAPAPTPAVRAPVAAQLPAVAPAPAPVARAPSVPEAIPVYPTNPAPARILTHPSFAPPPIALDPQTAALQRLAEQSVDTGDLPFNGARRRTVMAVVLITLLLLGVAAALIATALRYSKNQH